MRCVLVARPRFATSFGPIFMSQISSKNSVQLKDRLLCWEMLRVMVFPLVVKWHKHSFIKDTDILVLTIGQFNTSQNRKISLHTHSPICINCSKYLCVLIYIYRPTGKETN